MRTAPGLRSQMTVMAASDRVRVAVSISQSTKVSLVARPSHSRLVSDLNNISLASRQLYQIAREELYRKVNIGTRQLRFFLWTVIRNPDLASLVRNVIFSFEEYGEYVERLPMDDERNMPDDIMDDFMRVAHSSAYDWTDEEMSRLISGYVDAEATLLLQLLPNVVSLDLDFPTWDLTENESHQEQGIFRHDLLRKYLNQTHEEISDGESFLASLERFYMPNPYQAAFTLKSAYPPCWYWDITELPGVFSFPHLKSLSLERCASSGDKTLYIVGKRGGIGKLEELSITEAALEACDLDWILTLPNALKSFKYAVPRLDELFEDWSGRDRPRQVTRSAPLQSKN